MSTNYIGSGTHVLSFSPFTCLWDCGNFHWFEAFVKRFRLITAGQLMLFVTAKR